MNTAVIIVHTLEHARTALGAAAEIGAPVVLRSAPGAASNLGAAVFRDMIALAATEFPAATFTTVLDCDDQPGLALNALRRGIMAIRVDGTPEVAARIADIAAQTGATVDTSDGPTLDLLDVEDPETACRVWLSAELEKPS
jgi:fructose/tagatose bisphosphate aldolase